MRSINILMIGLLLICISSAQAVIVFDPSNFVENKLTALNSIKDLVNQATQIQHQLENLQYQAKNIRGVSDYQWRDVNNSLDQLNQVSQQGQALSVASSNLDSEFRKQFPDYAQTQTNNNYSTQYQQWNNTTMDTLRGTMDAAGYSATSAKSEETALQQLKSQGANAQGRMQVLQVSTEIAAENVNQLQELKRLMVNQSNAQNAYMAYKVEQQGYQEKNLAAINNNISTQFPKYKNNPQFGLMPVSR